MPSARHAQPPDRPEQGPKADPPSVRTRRCPSCGRDQAVVFEIGPSADGQPAERREVCLACCPKAAGAS
jgi:hypothetical protein